MANWATTKRTNDKARKALQGARNFLEATWVDPDENDATWRAEQILLAAISRVTDELEAQRRALGVGVYQPYGPKTWARKY